MKELKGFAKVFLEAGEEKEIRIKLDRQATSFWDEIQNSWVSESGTYGVHVGESSQNIVLTGKFVVEATTTWRGL